MNFEPVRTKIDLLTLDADEITAGFVDGYRDNPDQVEPGPNRGRSYWHGYCNAMRDKGDIVFRVPTRLDRGYK